MPDGEALFPDGEPPCSCKVGRSAAAYGCSTLDDELRRRHADGASLRDLERFTNRRLLERALDAAGVDVMGDAVGVFEALAGDDARAGARTEIRHRLSQAGVDVQALEGRFVSYGTIRTHLRECLGVETERSGGVSVGDVRATIAWARSRSSGVIERTLARLQDGGELDAGELELTQVTRVTCLDCGATYPVDALLDRGGCDCDAGD